MKTKNIKEFKLKDGTVIPANMECTLIFNGTAKVEIQVDLVREVRTFNTSCRNLPHYFAEIEMPSMEDLRDAVFDGICPSVLGNSVEPDGWDEEKSPSWMIALGMI
jgi:hypothetical protein